MEILRPVDRIGALEAYRSWSTEKQRFAPFPEDRDAIRPG